MSVGLRSASPFVTGCSADKGRMECGGCWNIYDPRLGDPVFGIPPGTPFSSLPESWSCPRRHTKPLQFLPEKVKRSESGSRPVSDMPRVEKLVAAYGAVAQHRMRELPVFNAKLKVEAVGFQGWGECTIGVLITPWFMNVVLVPLRNKDWSALQEGAQIGWALPSERYTFVVGQLEGFGTLQSCSLFSPMNMFQEQRVARLTAEAALEAILQPDESTGVQVSRRDFIKRYVS